MENILTAVFGIVFVIIGICHRKGNISLLHSYHLKNVKEEDKLPLVKLVGTGDIVIGATLIISSAMGYVAELLNIDLLATASSAVLAVGLVGGCIISLYAIKKYNHSIF